MSVNDATVLFHWFNHKCVTTNTMYSLEQLICFYTQIIHGFYLGIGILFQRDHRNGWITHWMAVFPTNQTGSSQLG